MAVIYFLSSESKEAISALSDELTAEYEKSDDKKDKTALFNIGYGLYVVTSKDDEKHNGLIVNTVTQVTDTPLRVAVTINKANYSHHIIKKTGKMNVNCLSVDAPFSVFENFGMKSGRNADKFSGVNVSYSDNGLAVLGDYINSYMCLEVIDYVDLGTHGMFIADVVEAKKVKTEETMTYTYYQKNVKPKPDAKIKKGYVCKICGYVYEGDPLPEDFICPWCKHPASDFEPLQ